MDWTSILASTLAAAIGVETVVYALAAIGLNVHFGYTGLLNFGQAAFLAVAAYGLGISVAQFGLPFWLGLLLGLAGAVLLALLLGIPTLRLRADYLAIVTIAGAEIYRLFNRSTTATPITGGSDGLAGFDDGFYALNPLAPGSYGIGPVEFSERRAWVLICGWVLVAFACLVVFLLMRSPWGRVLKGIREDEDAVRSLGKNVYSYKLQSLIVGGVLGCLGGYVLALDRANVQPDNYSTELTFFTYTILILGGAARVLGPVVGAAIFWLVLVFVQVALSQAVRAEIIPSAFMSTTQVGAVRFMIVGLALMLLVIYRPQGIFGDRRELAFDVR